MAPTFGTLEREHRFRHPSHDQTAFPALSDAVAPHIQSFNALTDDSLLDYAVKDLGVKSVFDTEEVQESSNKLSCKSALIHYD